VSSRADLPSELAELLDGAREAPPVPAERLAKVGLRLERTLSIPPMLDLPLREQALEAARSAAPGVVASALRAFVQHKATLAGAMYLSGVLSTVAVEHQLAQRHDASPALALRSVVTAPVTAPTASGAARSPVEWVPIAPPPSAPTVQIPVKLAPATPSAVPSAPRLAPVSSLAGERQLLEVARAALSRSRPTEALAALDEHARRFPAGELDEERDSLRVEALVATGSFDEARAAADHFNAKYPDSMLRASIRHALRSIP